MLLLQKLCLCLSDAYLYKTSSNISYTFHYLKIRDSVSWACKQLHIQWKGQIFLWQHDWVLGLVAANSDGSGPPYIWGGRCSPRTGRLQGKKENRMLMCHKLMKITKTQIFKDGVLMINVNCCCTLQKRKVGGLKDILTRQSIGRCCVVREINIKTFHCRLLCTRYWW